MFDKKGIENEILLDYRINGFKDLKLKVSQASFKVKDIKSFVYGPFTSRFWTMRKHIMSMNRKDFNYRCPYKAWDCITITIRN